MALQKWRANQSLLLPTVLWQNLQVSFLSQLLPVIEPKVKLDRLKVDSYVLYADLLSGLDPIPFWMILNSRHGLIIWGLWVFQVTVIKAFHEYEQCMWRGLSVMTGLNHNHHQSLGYVNRRLGDNRKLLAFLPRMLLSFFYCFYFQLFYLCAIFKIPIFLRTTLLLSHLHKQ